MSDEIYTENVSISSDIQPYCYTKRITNALDAKGWKYRAKLHSEDLQRDRIKIEFHADNLPTVRVMVVCDENGRRVSLYIYDILKLPNAEPASLYKLIQTLHFNFIFARWMFDEKDKTLQAEWYTHMTDSEDAGQIVADAVSRLAGVVDEAYPLIMQTCAELSLFQ